MNLKERFKKLVDINGEDFQLEIAIEEASEFIHAAQKLKRGRVNFDEVIGEMADVLVTINCLVEALRLNYPNIDALINEKMMFKTDWVKDYTGKGHKKVPLTWQDFK